MSSKKEKCWVCNKKEAYDSTGRCIVCNYNKMLGIGLQDRGIGSKIK